MSYSQFGYSYTTTPQLLVATSAAAAAAAASSGGGGGCCDRPTVVTDPLTGQPVCSCQYDSRTAALALPRLAAAPNMHQGSSVYDGSGGATPYAAAAAAAAAAYASAGLGLDHAALYSPLGNPYALKEGSSDVSAWQGLTQTPSYYAYDPAFAAYTAGYGTYDFNSARRKNATRETTATLKAWLSEHKKNPYPTKGEKIMLAIITKMTLTQVSTWFANARRRLKKENKMTWEPKNKTGDDDDDDDDDADEATNNKGNVTTGTSDSKLPTAIKDEPDLRPLCSARPPGVDNDDEVDDDDDFDDDDDDFNDDDPHHHHHHHHHHSSSRRHSPPSPTVRPHPTTTVVAAKPKIWSLADTATCKTPPPPPSTGIVGAFPPGQTWVPSLGAFQALSHPPSSSTSQFGVSRSPAVGAPAADTPPHTPPGLKGPHGGVAGDALALNMATVAYHHQHSRNTQPAFVTAASVLPPRMHHLACTGTEQRDLIGGSRNSLASSSGAESLYNNVMSEVSSGTAFKPIFKRENPWS